MCESYDCSVKIVNSIYNHTIMGRPFLFNSGQILIHCVHIHKVGLAPMFPLVRPNPSARLFVDVVARIDWHLMASIDGCILFPGGKPFAKRPEKRPCILGNGSVLPSRRRLLGLAYPSSGEQVLRNGARPFPRGYPARAGNTFLQAPHPGTYG